MTNGNDKERGSGLLDALQAKQQATERTQIDGLGRLIVPPKTHDEKVERRLLAIAWFTGIVAAAVVANFVATIVIAAAAASTSLY